MEKITKKQFREMLEENSTALVGVVTSARMSMDEICSSLDVALTDEFRKGVNWRHVLKVGSDKDRFNDGCYVDFAPYTDYYKHGDCIILRKEDFKTLVYLVA